MQSVFPADPTDGQKVPVPPELDKGIAYIFVWVIFYTHTLILLLTAMLGYILIRILLSFISKDLTEIIKMSQNIEELFKVSHD